ncbi:MAG TPA: DNA recombination protein RmuC [Candidatus Paceibacterota bacterium]|nr:DNA recombination protein RmuC [Candidatus Paceibacterota bacterium]
MQALYIAIGVIAGGILVALFSYRKRPTPSEADPSGTAFQLLLQQMNALQQTVDQKLGDSEKSMREGLLQQSHQANMIIKNVTEELTRLSEGTKQVISLGDNIKQLEDILKNPKQRGVLGEYYLETLLKNVLPPGSYEMQYPFNDGSIVDAVVFVKDKVIPIDSKFSLENYNRLVEEKDPTRREELEKQFKNDLKARIDETSKYIKPAEGTLEFAFMFIPHEAIYYDLLVAQVGGMKVNTRDLIEYAFKDKKVIIVSPTSFLAFLQTVLQGLNALKIEKNVQEIIKHVGELGRHLKAHEDYHNKVGTALQTVQNHYNTASKELKKINKDVLRIADTDVGIDPVLIEGKTERTVE